MAMNVDGMNALMKMLGGAGKAGTSGATASSSYGRGAASPGAGYGNVAGTSQTAQKILDPVSASLIAGGVAAAGSMGGAGIGMFGQRKQAKEDKNRRKMEEKQGLYDDIWELARWIREDNESLRSRLSGISERGGRML
jgi:hypothetical protein